MTDPERTGDTTMTLDTIVAAAAALAILIGPLVIFSALALRYGVDSRPGIDDRDQRPWLVPTRPTS